MTRLRTLASVALVALSLLGCTSKREKEAAKRAALAAALTVPLADPKDFVRGTMGYLDKLSALEAEIAALRTPPLPAVEEKLAPAIAWIAAARKEHEAMEAAFRAELGGLENEAHADLSKAVIGAETKSAREMGETIAKSRVKLIALWHGTGQGRGFDEDHQNLPYPERRAVDPSSRFIVGYVQRVDGEGVHFVNEKVTAERKIAIVALYEMPNRRRLGVFTVQGEAAALPTPVPLAGTVLPGVKPRLIEGLLGSP